MEELGNPINACHQLTGAAQCWQHCALHSSMVKECLEGLAGVEEHLIILVRKGCHVPAVMLLMS